MVRERRCCSERSTQRHGFRGQRAYCDGRFAGWMCVFLADNLRVHKVRVPGYIGWRSPGCVPRSVEQSAQASSSSRCWWYRIGSNCTPPHCDDAMYTGAVGRGPAGACRPTLGTSSRRRSRAPPTGAQDMNASRVSHPRTTDKGFVVPARYLLSRHVI
jgi:hypothetical protein